MNKQATGQVNVRVRLLVKAAAYTTMQSNARLYTVG
jgi:hypothetical protein